MIKYFGIIILATYFEFGDRASMWSTISQSKYRSDPDFGKTCMNRHRFDILWRHVRWIYQTDVQDEGTSREDHRWEIVEYFVTNFNKYCTQLFSPSDIICADESILRWYGQGGHWINLGFSDVCGNGQEAREWGRDPECCMRAVGGYDVARCF